MSDAAAWLQSRGIHQWDWVLGPRGREVSLRRINEAETYLVLDQCKEPIATFTLQWEDAEVWGERGRDGLAGYVHGMAVARRAAGQGLGSGMLDLAGYWVANKGRPLLRLDCMARNSRLCEYYRREGFTDLGIVNSDSGEWAARLFERVAKSKSVH